MQVTRPPVIAVALALATLGPAAQATGSLVLSPSLTSAVVGDLISVDVRGMGFGAAVIGGGFNLSFNPSFVSLSHVLIDGVEWDFLTNPGSIDNPAGTLTGVWFNAFATPLPTGSFPIATLSFTALAPGLAGLSLQANAGFPFVSDQVELINVSYGSGVISVVPEPSTWASLALGLSVLPWLARRRFPA